MPGRCRLRVPTGGELRAYSASQDAASDFELNKNMRNRIWKEKFRNEIAVSIGNVTSGFLATSAYPTPTEERRYKGLFEEEQAALR